MPGRRSSQDAERLQTDENESLLANKSRSEGHAGDYTDEERCDPERADGGNTTEVSPYRDRRALDAEILSMALPMLAALAADPLAGLVDSAYLGHAGSSQLAAVGVALSVFNTLTKLFNTPLLSVTTGCVAKATGEARRAAAAAASSPADREAGAAGSSQGCSSITAASATTEGSASAGHTSACVGSAETAAQSPSTAGCPAAPLASPSSGGAAAAPGPAGTSLHGKAACTASSLATAADDNCRSGSATAARTGSKTSTNSDVTPSRTATTAATAAVTATDQERRAALSCLFLAFLAGLLQAGLLVAGGRWALCVWGVPHTSPMFAPAWGFLSIRALGAPVTVLMLSLQGVFRGLQDTRTPLLATLLANGVNLVLAPVLIFGARLGAVGAAVGTVSAQAITVGYLLRQLRTRLPPLPPSPASCQQLPQKGVSVAARDQVAAAADNQERWSKAGHVVADGKAHEAEATVVPPRLAAGGAAGRLASWCWETLRDTFPLFKPTGLLILRLASVMVAYAVATTLVAHAGEIVTASHQICFQLWLASSLLADALAVAAQSLMARDLGAGSVQGATQVAGRVGEMAGALGLGLACALAAGHRGLPALFSRDPLVLGLVRGLFPIICVTQPITVLAMTWDGILFGAGGFRYAAFSMNGASIPAIITMVAGSRMWARHPKSADGSSSGAHNDQAEDRERQGVSGSTVLAVVWAGLTVLMLMRWLVIVVPYMLRVGPFRQMRKRC
ncbi:hypothetical protein Agub_g14320 [Astrephomene gubernaculifera]|uniref:Protein DETOXIFICATION n=1 Tax=Astrephomene gubernaculifera TaxID=47775 RepID=A0AAD3E1A4_9CHLO|nr:hypothetical protein Agub_g14320 [Astrephomene gubernaculifera]